MASVLRQINTLFHGKFVAVVKLLKDSAGRRVVRATSKYGVDAVVKITSNAEPASAARAAREIKLLRMFQYMNASRICGMREQAATSVCTAVVLECMELGTAQDLLDNSVAIQHTYFLMVLT